MPRLSVIMSVHNGAAYLGLALNSILSQQYKDTEYIVVDDGSTDNSLEILERYRSRDSRLQILSQSNKGLTASLNRALGVAQGEYIARMDADDESLPDRFAQQVAFLDANPRIGVCGTWVQLLGESTIWRYPVDNASIRSWLLFQPMLCHPSIMLRRSVLEMHTLRYDETYRYGQDYDLWVRMMQYTEFANLNSVLLRYRIHTQQVSQKYRSEQDSMLRQTQYKVLTSFGIIPDAEEQEIHYWLSILSIPSKTDTMLNVEAWLLKLLMRIDVEANQLTYQSLVDVVAQKWHDAHVQLPALSLMQWVHYLRSPLSRPLYKHYRRKLSLLRRILITGNHAYPTG